MRDFIGFFTFVILILLALSAVWFGLRSHGLSQPISDYQTAVVKKLTQSSDTTPYFWSKSSQTHPLVEILFDGQNWHLKGEKLLLQSWLKQTSPHSIPRLIFFEAKDSKALPNLRKIIKQNQLGESAIFCSRFDGLLRDLRELEPDWTFCNGEIFMTRLLSFNSLDLGSLLTISADVLFIHKTTKISNSDLQKLVDEGKRQNKLVFIGPVTRPLESINADGWVVVSEDQKVQ